MRSGRRRVLAAQPEALDEVVDVGEMVVDLAAARASESGRARRRETASAAADRRVRRCRSAARSTTSMPSARAGFARQPLAFELGVLVDVAGLERRVFVGRRMLDVAVDADRAAVHHAPDAGARPRPRRASPTAVGVDGAVGVRRKPGLPVDRGDVIDDVDARRRRARARARSRRSPDDQLDARRVERAGARPASRTSARTVVAARGQRAREVAAGEAGRAGYEDAHRSATSVTGEPNSLQQARRARARPRSTA